MISTEAIATAIAGAVINTIDVACPKCNAEPGRSCHTRTGTGPWSAAGWWTRGPEPHAARIRLAEAGYCDHCGAKAGQACTTSSGARTPRMHRARQRAVLGQMQAPTKEYVPGDYVDQVPSLAEFDGAPCELRIDCADCPAPVCVYDDAQVFRNWLRRAFPNRDEHASVAVQCGQEILRDRMSFEEAMERYFISHGTVGSFIRAAREHCTGTEVSVLEVDCPRCQAAPAQRCTTSSGRICDTSHAPRIQLARMDGCRDCGAEIGRPCVDGSGVVMERPHRVRLLTDPSRKQETVMERAAIIRAEGLTTAAAAARFGIDESNVTRSLRYGSERRTQPTGVVYYELPPGLIDIPNASRKFGVPVGTLRAWVHRGKLPRLGMLRYPADRGGRVVTSKTAVRECSIARAQTVSQETSASPRDPLEVRQMPTGEPADAEARS